MYVRNKFEKNEQMKNPNQPTITYSTEAGLEEFESTAGCRGCLCFNGFGL